MRRSCAREGCGKSFDAKRASAKFCSTNCRVAAHKSAASVTVSDPSAGRTFAKTLAALEDAGRAGSWRGALALTLAERVDATPGSGAAALGKQLEATMEAALEGVGPADEMDELRARRDRKRAAG